jgi:spore maturation protein CgeB
MKIVLVSPKKVIKFGLEIFYKDAFEKLGHEVHLLGLIDYSNRIVKEKERIHSRLGKIKRYGNAPYFYSQDLADNVKKIQPDLTIVFKCEAMSPTLLSYIKDNTSGALWNIYADHPFAIPGPGAVQLAPLLSLYDCVFTFSRTLFPVFYQIGAKEVQWLPFGYGENQLRSIQPNPSILLAYFGAWGPIQERLLSELDESELSIFGPNWAKTKYPNVRGMWKENEGMGTKMTDNITDTQIIFNLVRAEHGVFHTMKTFEIPAGGGFLLSNYSPDQELFFDADKEMIFFNTIEEAKDKIAYYKKHPELRDKIRYAAQKRVKKHTYTNRAKQILSYLEKGKMEVEL